MSASDKARHAAQDVKGKVKEAVGGATGDADLEASGKADQAGAAVKRAGDRAKDAAADVMGKVSDEVAKAGRRIEDAIDEHRGKQ